MKEHKKSSHVSLREFLKQELNRRCQKNSKYSLRAFAKHLTISHSTLSQILSSKRPITNDVKKKIAIALQLSNEQIKSFKINKPITFTEKFAPLDTSTFDVLAWQDDAILELTHLDCFQPDIDWIAKTLNLTTTAVSSSVNRLLDLKLLKITKTGTWIDQSLNNSNNYVGNYTTESLRAYQKNILEKSITAIDKIPREQRDHTSLILSFSKEEIKQVKEFLKSFRTNFMHKADMSKKTKNEVYALSLSFFPISQIMADKENK